MLWDPGEHPLWRHFDIARRIPPACNRRQVAREAVGVVVVFHVFVAAVDEPPVEVVALVLAGRGFHSKLNFRPTGTLSTFYMAESGLPYLRGSSESYPSARSSKSAMSAVKSAMSAVDREVAWQTATVQHAFNAQLVEGGQPAQDAFRVYLRCKMQAEHEFRCLMPVGAESAPAWCGTRTQLRRQQREAQVSREKGVPGRAQHLCSESARRAQKRARDAASASGAGACAKAASGERVAEDVAAARVSCGMKAGYDLEQGGKLGDVVSHDGDAKNGTTARAPAAVPSPAPAPLSAPAALATVSRPTTEDAGDTVAHVPPRPPTAPPAPCHARAYAHLTPRGFRSRPRTRPGRSRTRGGCRDGYARGTPGPAS